MCCGGCVGGGGVGGGCSGGRLYVDCICRLQVVMVVGSMYRWWMMVLGCWW